MCSSCFCDVLLGPGLLNHPPDPSSAEQVGRNQSPDPTMGSGSPEQCWSLFELFLSRWLGRAASGPHARKQPGPGGRAASGICALKQPGPGKPEDADTCSTCIDQAPKKLWRYTSSLTNAGGGNVNSTVFFQGKIDSGDILPLSSAGTQWQAQVLLVYHMCSNVSSRSGLAAVYPSI